jgi:hypothetical protein
MKIWWFGIYLLLISPVYADFNPKTTLPLSPEAVVSLRKLVNENGAVADLWQELKNKLENQLDLQPRPLEKINYEGLLDTNPLRITTEQHLQDIDVVADLLMGFYITGDQKYCRKIQEYLLAWSGRYLPTGNPINENKLEPLAHAFYVLKENFNTRDRRKISNWLNLIAAKLVQNEDIPVNNWESKRIKLLQSISIATGNQKYARKARKFFERYLNVALYPDGTSEDLKERDALHYHLSGLDPLILYAIMVNQQAPAEKNMFLLQSDSGASLKKSVDYVVPYATGELQHQEWVNSKVELDKKRAAAGLDKYKSGKLFNPTEALETFILASYFDQNYLPVVQQIEDCKELVTCLNRWDLIYIYALVLRK